MREILPTIREILDSGRRGAMATVIETSGSSPQKPGSRMLLLPDGRTVGTVGGGAVEHHVIEALRECMAGKEASTLDVDLATLGMSCGGRMSVFIEPLQSPPRLVLFGAGHVGVNVASMAQRIGFSVTVIDERPDQNSPERFPSCQRILEPIEDAMTSLHAAAYPGFETRASESARDDTGMEPPWFLIFTHDHSLDELALSFCLATPHSYVGLIGSRRKVFKMLRGMKERGPLPPLNKLYAPVGLDIGAESPEEISMSIVAELVAVRHARGVGHLSLIGSPLLESVLEGEATVEEAVVRARQGLD